MGPDPKPPLIKLSMEVFQAPLEPRALDRDLEILEAKLQEFFVGQ
jgi:hypothetical protein